MFMQAEQEVQPTSYAQRAYHPDMVQRSGGRLQIDVEWYLTQQILPPIARLCEPIEGTSSASIAERLGLDGSKFARSQGDQTDGSEMCDYIPSCRMTPAERFKTAR